VNKVVYVTISLKKYPSNRKQKWGIILDWTLAVSTSMFSSSSYLVPLLFHMILCCVAMICSAVVSTTEMLAGKVDVPNMVVIYCSFDPKY